jgi:hypothetical protein
VTDDGDLAGRVRGLDLRARPHHAVPRLVERLAAGRALAGWREPVPPQHLAVAAGLDLLLVQPLPLAEHDLAEQRRRADRQISGRGDDFRRLPRPA